MSSVPTDDRNEGLAARPERPGIGARIKRLLPRTIEGRTLAIIVIPVFIAQIVTPVLFFERHFSSLSRGLAFAVAGDIAAMIDDMEREPDNRQQIFLAFALEAGQPPARSLAPIP